MSFKNKMEQQEKEAQEAGHASKGGDWFKFVEGDNIFRILTEPEMIFEKYKVGICYTDCGYEGTPRFMCYVSQIEKGLDGTDVEVVKLAKLPYKIGSQVAELESDEDYAFAGFPMPYNLKVKAKNAGTKEVEYTLIASPKRSEVGSDVKEHLAKLKPIPELIQKMKENLKEKHVQDGTWQANQERKAKLQAEIDARKPGGVSPEKVIDAETNAPPPPDYPEEEINPEDIPF